jgi:hypothetical protein
MNRGLTGTLGRRLRRAQPIGESPAGLWAGADSSARCGFNFTAYFALFRALFLSHEPRR